MPHVRKISLSYFTLILISLLVLLPVQGIRPKAVVQESNGLFIYSEGITNRTALLINKNGTNISFRNLRIFNFYSHDVSYVLWQSGTIPSSSWVYLEYTGESTSMAFSFLLGNQTVLSGILKFTVSSVQVVEIGDIGFIIENIVSYWTKIVFSFLIAAVPGCLLGIYAKKQNTKEVREL